MKRTTFCTLFSSLIFYESMQAVIRPILLQNRFVVVCFDLLHLSLLSERSINRISTLCFRGGSRGGGVLGVRTTPPPPFGGPPNFIKRGKMARACARKLHVLVLNSYPDPPPLSEILYPPLCFTLCLVAVTLSFVF